MDRFGRLRRQHNFLYLGDVALRVDQMQKIKAIATPGAEADCGSIGSDTNRPSKTRKKVLYDFPHEIFSINSNFSIEMDFFNGNIHFLGKYL